SKEVVLSPQVMRFVSDDRVMKAAEGVMDARIRFRAAWDIIRNGHELPAIDPALDDSIGRQENGSNGAAVKVNGSSLHLRADSVTPPSGSNGRISGGTPVAGKANGANGHAATGQGTNGSAVVDGNDFESSLKARSNLAA